MITTSSIKAYAIMEKSDYGLDMIPMTDELCSNLGKYFIKENEGQTTFLMIDVLPEGAMLNDGAYTDTLPGIIVRNGLNGISLRDREVMKHFTAPWELLFPPELADTDYLKLLTALKNPNVTQICSNNTMIVSRYFDMLMKYKDDICFDIACGTISHGNESAAELGRHIIELNVPDRERAVIIRQALSKPVCHILKSIWPKLERITAEGGGRYDAYTSKIQPWCENVRLESGDLITPFGILGRGAIKPNTYELNLDEAFYEFLPAKATDGQTVLMTDLLKDRKYEIILTNEHGMYRLHTNIFIEPLHVSEYGLWFKTIE